MSWTRFCAVVEDVPDVDGMDRFFAAAPQLYRLGRWLPPPMALDAWVVAHSDVFRMEDPGLRAGAGYPDIPRAYYRWLETWQKAMWANRGEDRADPDRLWLVPAVRLAHQLARIVDVRWLPSPPEDPNEFDDWAKACVTRSLRRHGRVAEATRAAYRLFADGDLAKNEDSWRPTLLEMENMSPCTQSAIADRVVFRLASTDPPRRRRGVAQRLVSQAPGKTAYRRTRGERGVYLERGPGPLPGNPARLVPLEFLYAESTPLLFWHRVASNQVERTFGARVVPDRRRPRVLVEIEVTESAAWHRACAGSPFGLVSTARTAVGAILVGFQLAFARTHWDLAASLEWSPVGASGGGSRAESHVKRHDWSRRDLERLRNRRDAAWEVVLRCFPEIALPAHRVGEGRDGGPGEHRPVDGRIRIRVCDDPRSGNSNGPGPQPWLVEPVDHGRVQVRLGGRSRPAGNVVEEAEWLVGVSVARGIHASEA